MDLGLEQGLAPASVLNLQAGFRTETLGGLVFDAYGSADFKFVALMAESDQVVIGHHTALGQWVYDAVLGRAIDAGAEYELAVRLDGTRVHVALDGIALLDHAYNAVVVDGGFGLLTGTGGSSFDRVSFETSDPALEGLTLEDLAPPPFSDGDTVAIVPYEWTRLQTETGAGASNRTDHTDGALEVSENDGDELRGGVLSGFSDYDEWSIDPRLEFRTEVTRPESRWDAGSTRVIDDRDPEEEQLGDDWLISRARLRRR